MDLIVCVRLLTCKWKREHLIKFNIPILNLNHLTYLVFKKSDAHLLH